MFSYVQNDVKNCLKGMYLTRICRSRCYSFLKRTEPAPRGSAYAISKDVRRSKKKFIAVTCHYDVVDWLEPDWVFCTDTMEFSRKKG